MKLLMEQWRSFKKKINEVEEFPMNIDDERESIRGFSKDLTGQKDSYMIPDNFESMSREELIELVRDMKNSPEGQDFEREMRDEEDLEIGMQGDELDNSPKQSGMGRGMREELSDPEADHGADMYDPERRDTRIDQTQMSDDDRTPQQVLSDELEDYVRDNLSDLVNQRKLDTINNYVDALYDNSVSDEDVKRISSNLKAGNYPLA